MTCPEIATLLNVSVRTVETHLQNVARRIGVGGREHLLHAVGSWLRPRAA